MVVSHIADAHNFIRDSVSVCGAHVCVGACVCRCVYAHACVRVCARGVDALHVSLFLCVCTPLKIGMCCVVQPFPQRIKLHFGISHVDPLADVFRVVGSRVAL